ncbi:MAG: endonuclease MutS2 [Gemmatimonadota bacterium]|nr:endonuclease MutS2 [Gemmatimonadota bacterium]
MSDHALAVLEFERVLERIAERAASDPGRRKVHALRPRGASDDVARELGRVRAVMRFAEERPEWGMPPVPDVEASLKRAGVDGAVLEAAELHDLGVLMGSSRELRRVLDGAVDDGVRTLRAALVDFEELEKEIQRSVDADGSVLDTASKELRRLRDRLRGAHGRVVKRLDAYLSGLSERYVVPDASVTVREGRYVVPVRREARSDVGGIVHDESQTGATLYVEPPEAIEAMNELRDLEREEKREVQRVLRSLTGRLAPVHAELRGALDALADFDALQARARVAMSWRAEVPEILGDPSHGIRLVGARHPLLVETQGLDSVVPFDLDLDSGERAVVVSGPNTGGKSVFLKATGLIAALAQSGVVPPVGPGTRLPVFGSFYADIGDEQSIARNLSTFSAHLENLSEIVQRADARSLVLVDEMGTGTDPSEGAALARAILEELVSQGALTLASSHLGELKRLAGEGTGVVNASLQFDSARMEPTYRLQKGRPGRSYGLAIARTLGFPGRVLDRAEGYRDDDEAKLEETLARLEERDREADRLVHELDRERARAARLGEELERRERALEEAEASHAERARDEARQLLLDARSEVEAAVQEVRRAAEEGTSLDAAIHEARGRVERAAERNRPAPGASRSDRPAPTRDFAEGDRVRLKATGAKGRIVERRSNRAVVEAGAIKLEAALSDLELIEAAAADPDSGGGASTAEPAPSGGGGGWSAERDGGARVEVDLRGLRVHELEVELARALDEAVFEDLPELRIIHGKGTGALRKRVGEMLEADARVRSMRMGRPTEGGAGVTVAGFREGA